MLNKTVPNLRITPIECCTSWLGRGSNCTQKKKKKTHQFKTFLLRSPPNTSGGRTKLHERVVMTARMQHTPTLPYLAMSCSIVKEESFYEEQSVRHLFSMLRGLQLSDVTSPRPQLASAAAADRSDVHSGSQNVKGRSPGDSFSPKPLRSALRPLLVPSTKAS